MTGSPRPAAARPHSRRPPCTRAGAGRLPVTRRSAAAEVPPHPPGRDLGPGHGEGPGAIAPGPCTGLLPSGSAAHLRILVTRPAPTVRPPSRIANFRPSSIAIGWMSSTVISVLSPGMTISVPSGSFTTPVTSVVRK